MKGFPRRGSDIETSDEETSVAGLNEGLPQKGKRYRWPSHGRVPLPRLNEGLPQKGKR